MTVRLTATLARTGLSTALNSVSVTFMLLMFTGRTRVRPKMNSTSGGFAERVKLNPPDDPSRHRAPDRAGSRPWGDHCLERREPGQDAELLGDRIALVELVGGVEAQLEADGLLADGHLLCVAQRPGGARRSDVCVEDNRGADP
jgi:hypothetical protein